MARYLTCKIGVPLTSVILHLVSGFPGSAGIDKMNTVRLIYLSITTPTAQSSEQTLQVSHPGTFMWQFGQYLYDMLSADSLRSPSSFSLY